MNQLQMLKRAMIDYVTNSLKAIWSAVAHPLMIVGKKYCDVAAYRIYGNSIQEGTPTYETPVEIQSVGDYDDTTGKYKVPIVLSTENLLDLSRCNTSHTTRYGERGIKQIRVTDTNSGVRFPVSIKTGTTLYLSFKFIDAGGSNTDKIIYMRAYPTDGGSSFIIFMKSKLEEEQRYMLTYNVKKDIKQVEFYTQYAWEVGSYYIIDDVELTTVEPKIHELILADPLRSVEGYADYIDYEAKKVIRNIASEHITQVDLLARSYTPNYTYLSYISKKPKTISREFGCISNKFSNGADYTYTGMKNKESIIQTYIATAGVNTVAYTFDGGYTLEEAQALIGDGFDVCYVLATPEEELIELPNLQQFKGTTIYEVNTEVKPSGMEVCYYE